MEQTICSQIHRVSQPEKNQQTLEALAGAANKFRPLPLPGLLPGHTLGQHLPLKDLKSIDTTLDEIALPGPLIASTLLRAKFVDYKSLAPLHMVSPVPVNVRFTGERQLGLDFFPGVYDRAMVAGSWLQLPPCVSPSQAQEIEKSLRVGMTRQVIESFVSVDGGISRSFHLERYLLKSGPSPGDKEAIKFNLAFKPEGMSDAVYLLGKWVAPSQRPGDVLMRISPPYRQAAYCD